MWVLIFIAFFEIAMFWVIHRIHKSEERLNLYLKAALEYEKAHPDVRKEKLPI